MSDTEQVEVENPSTNQILPKEVTEEIGSIKLFNKWTYEDVEIRDISLTDYIQIRSPVYISHSAGRYAVKRFRKAQCPIIERLTNSLMMNGRNNGKKLMAVRIVAHAFEIIHITTDTNPLQVAVDAIVNCGPREDSTRIGSAGTVRRQAVDVSPLRRVNQAIALLTVGAREAAFRNVKSVAECLAEELINAAKGSSNSYAIKKKDELERVAKSNRTSSQEAYIPLSHDLPSPSQHQLTRFQLRTALLLLFAIIAFLFFFKSYPSRTDVYHREFKGNEGFARVAKVSMLYGEENRIYERALRSHQKHDEKFNYPFYVLRENVASGYWNKPSYLLSLVVTELAKPKHERTEWLMWVDADLILINPSIPLEAFLPPDDFPHVHFLGNKDQNGLNTGTFFLHVHEWSVQMLTKTMAYPMFKSDVDLGTSADQVAMAYIFNETYFAPGVLFQPRTWYNTYEWKHAYEGKKGNLLVHFPGLEEERWSHMSNWLSIVENYPQDWEVPYEETFYPKETKEYWDAVRDGIITLNVGEELLDAQGDQADDTFKRTVDKLKLQVLFDADAVGSLQNETALLKSMMSETEASATPEQ